MDDISLHILDVAENSISAGATLVTISVSIDTGKDLLSVEIADNGRGIPKEVLGRIRDPFYTTRTTRKVGMGLSLLAQSAEEADGALAINSIEGQGTVVSAKFRYGHIDRKPRGNLADTFAVLITGNPHMDFEIRCRRNNTDVIFDTRELRSELEGIPLNTPDVISAVRDLLRDSLADFR